MLPEYQGKNLFSEINVIQYRIISSHDLALHVLANVPYKRILSRICDI